MQGELSACVYRIGWCQWPVPISPSVCVCSISHTAPQYHRSWLFAGDFDSAIPIFSAAVEFAQSAKSSFTARSGGLALDADVDAQTQERLLIHGRFGMNFSCAVATAVLMGVERLSLDEAWKIIRAACPTARPERSVRAQLVKWADHLAGPSGRATSMSASAEDWGLNDTSAAPHGAAKFFRTFTLPADKPFYRIGEQANEIFLILDGMVELLDAHNQIVLSLAPGNLFGYVDCHLKRPHSVSAFARRGTTMYTDSWSGALPTLMSSSPHPFNRMGGSSPRGSFNAGEPELDLHTAGVCVACISMAELQRMGDANPELAVKVMKLLVKQSSVELSNLPTGSSARY